jgi:hypothetical protein
MLESIASGRGINLLEALQISFVDVPLVGRPEFAAGHLAFVDGVIELARREAVADPVQLFNVRL